MPPHYLSLLTPSIHPIALLQLSPYPRSGPNPPFLRSCRVGGGLIVIIPQDRTLYRGQTPRHQVLYLTESECQKLNKEASCGDKYENMGIELECSGKNHFKLRLPGKGECIIGWWLMYLMAGGPDCIIANVQGVFFLHWYPPKKLKYGKPRLGESTLT